MTVMNSSGYKVISVPISVAAPIALERHLAKGLA